LSKSISMSDIAKELGISKVSVSKALSDKEGVSDELRQKIKEVARQMGYRFSASARSLKTHRQNNIGILISEKYIMDKEAYYFTVSSEIIRELDEYGNSGIMEIVTYEAEEQVIYPRVYNENKVDGIIVLGQMSMDYLKMIDHIDIPVIFLDFYVKELTTDAVVVDNFFISYQLTNCLISKGHKSIGYVGTINATSSIQDRYLGYYKSLIENNIPLNDDYVIPDRDHQGKFIEFDLPDELPTAFVCNCDRVAFSLIDALKKKGKRVPEDCSVVGFDNSIFSTLSSPQITTVDNNIDQMVETAVKVITKKISHPEKNYNMILIPGTIIERYSVERI